MTPKRNSLFSSIPLWKPKMSSFNLSFENKFSTDLFRLTPVMCKEVLPDDRVKIRPECFTRMSPAISPFFHRLNIRFYHFFVPTRIIWDDFEKWINPKSGATDIVAPRLTVATDAIINNAVGAFAFAPKSLADYLGVNFGLNAEDQASVQKFAAGLSAIFPGGSFTMSSLPFRAYQQVFNDWFIDLNNADPAEFSKGSGVEQLVSGSSTDNDALYSALLKLRYRAWEHDYFTSALPEPQRGPDVNAFDGGTVEISEIESTIEPASDDPTDTVPGYITRLVTQGVRFNKVKLNSEDTWYTVGDYIVNHFATFGFNDMIAAQEWLVEHEHDVQFYQTSQNTTFGNNGAAGSDNVEWPIVIKANGYSSAVKGKLETISSAYPAGAGGDTKIYTANLADHLKVNTEGTLSTNIPAVTVEELRVRMQMQSFLERNEVGGSRYTEMLFAHWGVKDPDGRLQRSEFLGGHTQPLVISDVQSTVADDENDKPLGMFAGQGTSANGGKTIKYRVPEHGYLITLMCVVPRSAYSQGLEKMWHRFDRLDYYWPSFSHLGEQEVLNSEVMFTGLEDQDGVFGYQSRYAEYKQSLDQVHGDLKGSLSHWHMGRLFDTPATADDLPKLSQNFTTPTDSDGDALSRVWPVLSGSAGGFEAANADHFVFDVYMHFTAGRRMPFFVTPRNGM